MSKYITGCIYRIIALTLCLFPIALTGCSSDKNGSVKEPADSDSPNQETTLQQKIDSVNEAIKNKTYTYDENTLGLTVDENGTILLAGKPYYAFGVNSFTLVIRYIEGAEKSMYRDQFELLKKYDIPFIRVDFGGFWPDYYERFDINPHEVIKHMRDVVECAEEYQIGLICSLLWEVGSIPYHVGENRASMGDPESQTVKYAKEYVTKIVNEFKDSPAVWAWEIGNEYNLGADLCDISRVTQTPDTPDVIDGYFFYSSEELAVFYREIGNAIRAVDPDRMISSGNGDMRDCAQSLQAAALAMNKNTHMWTEVWEQDTLEEFYNMCAYYTPDPIDGMCFHMQHAKQNADGTASFMILMDRFGSNISTASYLSEFVNASRLVKKALFFGEMGDMIWMEDDAGAPEMFKNITDWVYASGIQLASTWQFDKNNLMATDEGIDGVKLKILQEKNELYKEAGKADKDSYWKNK